MSALLSSLSTSQDDSMTKGQINQDLPHILITGVYGTRHRQLYQELSGDQSRKGNAVEFFFWKEILLTGSHRATISLVDTNHYSNLASILQSHRTDLVIIMGEHINNTTFIDYLLAILRFSSCPVLCLVSHADRLLGNFIKYPKTDYEHEHEHEHDIDQVVNNLKSPSGNPVFNPDTVNLFVDRMKTIVQELRSSHSAINYMSLPFDYTNKTPEDQYRICFQAMTEEIEGQLRKQVELFPELRGTFMDTDDVIKWILMNVRL
jgi:hypothetical protein